MKSKLNNIVNHLKIRKGMYIIDKESYSSLASFLIGFSIGCSEKDKNILDEFQNWLQEKEGKNFSLHWSSYILSELCDGDEKKASTTALELLQDFASDG